MEYNVVYNELEIAKVKTELASLVVDLTYLGELCLDGNISRHHEIIMKAIERTLRCLKQLDEGG
jgi:hypothetical protein